MSINFQPKFEAKIEHCPANPREELQCVGRFVIYAYLEVSGDVSIPGPTPAAAATKYRFSGKILPQRITLPFKVDFSDTATSNDEVIPCMAPVGEWGAGPGFEEVDGSLGGARVPVKVERVGVPVATAQQGGNCMEGKATFRWVSGVVNVALSGGGVVNTNLPLAGPISVNAGGSASAGVGGYPIPPLEVAYEVCYLDSSCVKTTIPAATATDAAAVFSAPVSITATVVP